MIIRKDEEKAEKEQKTVKYVETISQTIQHTAYQHPSTSRGNMFVTKSYYTYDVFVPVT